MFIRRLHKLAKYSGVLLQKPIICHLVEEILLLLWKSKHYLVSKSLQPSLPLARLIQSKTLLVISLTSILIVSSSIRLDLLVVSSDGTKLFYVLLVS
jgi:hypothetical protein